jgi:hypothetical protein
MSTLDIASVVPTAGTVTGTAFRTAWAVTTGTGAPPRPARPPAPAAAPAPAPPPELEHDTKPIDNTRRTAAERA